MVQLELQRKEAEEAKQKELALQKKMQEQQQQQQYQQQLLYQQHLQQQQQQFVFMQQQQQLFQQQQRQQFGLMGMQGGANAANMNLFQVSFHLRVSKHPFSSCFLRLLHHLRSVRHYD